MPSVPQNRPPAGGSPGTARNMPTMAVNTISATTRGLVSWKYSPARLANEAEAPDCPAAGAGSAAA